MKKAPVPLLILITCVFAAFLGGFFAGRNVSRAPVRISAVPSAPAAVIGTPAEPTTPQIIDINTATSQQLQTLPGIGPVLAQRIIDYRTENGPFRTAADLSNVEGIGNTTLESILDLITAGG